MSLSEGQLRWNNRVKVIRLRRFGYMQRVGLTGEHDRDTEIVVVVFKREQHKEKTLWDNLLFTLNFKYCIARADPFNHMIEKQTQIIFPIKIKSAAS